MIGLLTIDTDWDFGIVVNGENFCNSNFSIAIDSIEQLENIQYLGAFGTPLASDTKLWEVKNGIARILANPKESFSQLGGNRGVRWQAVE